MLTFIKQLFTLEKRPRKGLLALEWVAMTYLVLTLLIVFFTYTKAENPDAMIWGRIRIAVITAALWGVYRLIPCRLTLFIRVAVQLALLGWWYPDTYEINRMLPNLDHVFAGWEQDLFGCQPALLFHKALPWAFVSELMDMGYASYYPMIVTVVVFYFLFRYQEFERAAFVVLTSFFVYYVIFILVPVTGPTFYYKAVGLSDISKGIFPNVHDYFNYRSEERRVGKECRSRSFPLHPSAVLHISVSCHRLHSGTLRHRRPGRTGERNGAVLCLDAGIQGN